MEAHLRIIWRSFGAHVMVIEAQMGLMETPRITVDAQRKSNNTQISLVKLIGRSPEAYVALIETQLRIIWSSSEGHGMKHSCFAIGIISIRNLF